MKGFFLAVVVIGMIAAYMLYTPVPDGLTQPWKFRSIIAVNDIVNAVIKLQNLIWPDKPNDILTSRYTTGFRSPEPKSEVPGSKFRASMTYFNGVEVRLYQPIDAPDSLLPGFIYIHGGGYCLGSTKLYDGLTREFADTLNAVVVSIEYRLSPEHPFPAPFNDSLKAARWFISHAGEFGVDASRIGVGGDSAGGALTALVVQYLHDESDVPDPKLQVLFYPSLQKIDTNTPSYQKYRYYLGDNGILPVWRSARFLSYHVFGEADPDLLREFPENNHTSSEFKMSRAFDRLNHSLIPPALRDPVFYSGPTKTTEGDAWMWERIRGVFRDPRFSPLARTDLSGLPRAYIVTCGFDTLRDDGIFYAKALSEAGVDATWVNYESGFHGILWMGGRSEFELGKQMRRDALTFINEQL